MQHIQTEFFYKANPDLFLPLKFLCNHIFFYKYFRTVRLWDVNDEGKKQRHVIKPRSQQGRRVIPTACTYSHDGRWIVAACQDGSIQIWDHNRPFVGL